MTEAVSPKASPLLLSKSILARDSIIKRIDAGCGDQHHQKVKVSQLYQQLERRIDATKAKHRQELSQIDRQIGMFQKAIQEQKQGIHESKVELWELKNEVVYLEDMLEKEEDSFQEQFREEAEVLESDYSDQQPQEEEEQSQQDKITSLRQIFDKWDQEEKQTELTS